MKKYIISAIVLIFIIVPVSGQKSKDVLYLKNGSVINGTLMEVADNQYKIRTADGSIFIFPDSEVEKFVNEIPLFEGRKKSGLGFSLEAGFLVGSQKTEYPTPFSFNCVITNTLNTRNILGLGSGVEYLGQPFMPVFLEYKGLFTTHKTSPFFFMRAGKLFHVNGEFTNIDTYAPNYGVPVNYHGGFTMTIGTGISWSREDSETFLSFAYRNARTSYKELDYNKYTSTYRNTLNRLEVKFGFNF